MMEIYILDEYGFFISKCELSEDNKDTLNYTTKPMMVYCYKPKFNHSTQEWIEGLL